MNCSFYETPGFTRRLSEVLDDENYRQFQNLLQANPAKGVVVQGCGGIRKVRLEAPIRGKGKRGGCRVVYLHIPEAQCIYFIALYGKDEQDDLDADQKRQLKTLAEQTKEMWRKKQRRGKG